jgi:hypothetical protein
MRYTGTVICWLNGIPGNVTPCAQPIWIRFESKARSSGRRPGPLSNVWAA